MTFTTRFTICGFQAILLKGTYFTNVAWDVVILIAASCAVTWGILKH